jgi:hypothetical protein
VWVVELMAIVALVAAAALEIARGTNARVLCSLSEMLRKVKTVFSLRDRMTRWFQSVAPLVVVRR